MINPTESAEKAYLETVKQKLAGALAALGGRVRHYAREISEQKTYLWENKADMDHVEKVSARQSAHQMVLSGEALLAARKRIAKLLTSPYFGRFDFLRKEGDTQPMAVYVGLHAFADDTQNKNIIFDWRAPIATLFYDYEIGAAQYQSPEGPVAGDIVLKRQYRIRQGQMQFMLDSGLNILDDVLQEELSRTSDDRMKNIVATIQRDQNAIIRNEDARTLIIQGVAGSGKTSIALHRVAFLLYRHRQRLTSKDILIISPNKVFADFISNVLPELGEEQIAEIEMDGLARALLGDACSFQTFMEQSTLLLETGDAALTRRIEEKSTSGFVNKLEAYVAHVEESRFRPSDLLINGHHVGADVIGEVYRKQAGRPVSDRLRGVSEKIEQYLWSKCRYQINPKERQSIKASVKKMYRNAALRTLYKEFFAWLGKPELFKPASGASLEYADVFPMIYLKILLEGEVGRYKHIKHLVVDEMQDYTPVQYAVMAKLFACEKTILGDVHQSISPFCASSADTIRRIFRHADCVKLCKSYRSSYEITEFAQRISPNADLVAIERHGEAPRVLAFEKSVDELASLLQGIAGFPKSSFSTLGIICKTQRQAQSLYRVLHQKEQGVHLLTSKSTSFPKGVVICSAHLAKGLEFDQVIVPEATSANYATDLDRNLLYVACTRAMHRLIVTHVGARTRFIPEPLSRREDPPASPMNAKETCPRQKSTEAA